MKAVADEGAFTNKIHYHTAIGVKWTKKGGKKWALLTEVSLMIGLSSAAVSTPQQSDNLGIVIGDENWFHHGKLSYDALDCHHSDLCRVKLKSFIQRCWDLREVNAKKDILILETIL